MTAPASLPRLSHSSETLSLPLYPPRKPRLHPQRAPAVKFSSLELPPSCFADYLEDEIETATGSSLGPKDIDAGTLSDG
ncbi:MAG: hypothetical protein P4M11_10760 [Candidatus Pacebacteria bacterium]|nr:hypothetical protein [Candidatus Paceibacterota bacterium]